MKKKTDVRSVILLVVIFSIFAFFGGTLVKIQLVDGRAYAKSSSSVALNSVKVKASRGEIYDRNGNALVYNRQGNSIIFNAVSFPDYNKKQKERNRIILDLINLFEKNDEEYIDTLPIIIDEKGSLVFDKDRESDIEYLKSKEFLGVNSYATAQDCFAQLVERYSLEEYTMQDARKIASVCYEMKRLVFNNSNPYTFAEDVSTQIVANIKENSLMYPGVDVEIVSYREYTDGTLTPHILGLTGVISAQEYKERKDDGYGMNDVVGKSAIESAMEQYLRGEDGIKTISIDSKGNTTEKYTKEPIQGDSVILTIDKGMQEVLNKALEETAKSIESTNPENGAAAVVVDCNTGEVLASASYPTYDISQYREKYEELSEQAGTPLWNRALQSVYAPGSTAKPSVAMAALEEGYVDPSTAIRCTGTYRYLDHTFVCQIYHRSSYLNVKTALQDSCNIFFYETSRKLGIEKMNYYREMMGLGQKTGVEIGETEGTLDSPEYRESINQDWMPGFVLQSAIGQAGNLFTPIQLANYCATLANGGNRYQCHFVKSVKSADYTKNVLKKEPKLLSQAEFSDENVQTVKEGMRLVVTTGGARKYLNGLSVKSAAKTGTSQVEKTIDGEKQVVTNGFLITFAPYENPEIAIAIVIEGATSGGSTAPVAKAVYEYYFDSDESVDLAVKENQLLS